MANHRKISLRLAPSPRIRILYRRHPATHFVSLVPKNEAIAIPVIPV
jgi:hypothetical protein